MISFTFFALGAVKPLATKLLPAVAPVAVIGAQTYAQVFFLKPPALQHNQNRVDTHAVLARTLSSKRI